MAINHLGSCASVVVGPLILGWHAYPWAATPFVFAGILILHPVMNRDVPTLIDIKMLKSPRTYAAAVLFAVAQILGIPYVKALQEHFLTQR
jgi:uncharacterized membrane protein (DUF4010 family)